MKVCSTRLVVNSVDELLVMKDGVTGLDGERVMREGDLINSTIRESPRCPGTDEELQLWEVLSVEDGEVIRNHFEITKIIDVEKDTLQISNVREPWIEGHIIIR